jgi:orotate phosphoribosyltransferase
MPSPSDARARVLATDLLDIGAVLLRPDAPFTWASGLVAPIYCDNRLTLAHPPVRRRIASGFAETLAREGLAPEVVAGTATAGIPHAAWLAERLDRPMAYVRGAAKGHGRQNRIEGQVDDGQRVVLVEDLISTGGSSMAAVEALREAGATVEAVLAIFSYAFDAAHARFAEAGVPLHVLTTFPALVAVAAERGDLSDADRATLARWRANPEGWSADGTP